MQTLSMSSCTRSSGQKKAQASYQSRRFGLLLSLAFVFIVSGCKENKPAPSTDETNGENSAQKTIGVTLLNVQDRFYQDLRDGLKSEAEKLGYRILISTAEKDSSRQADQIDEFLFQRKFVFRRISSKSEQRGWEVQRGEEAKAEEEAQQVQWIVRGRGCQEEIA